VQQVVVVWRSAVARCNQAALQGGVDRHTVPLVGLLQNGVVAAT